ncbi:hypothetical protein, unlikely [Trypanosoma brucei gambiense DAL972]|uniref:Uncharacterized protein n=1 Tax=Trypanosoma brucei gambiense (strain MHOM/CI/86/DAL972) TaxID=679716 RepID=D0A6I3_TRYB9|nr:hypothetical protein, unlikely [Trypanosoma brucei gambiense DAL972]CBH17284.1 hypothetical protein, unlikely [Trypanosoma brucei gambiense DAL972]|eukprot:XP_011779548.1 hypothetical protein, unlikely [Trypanosoma brucei gambiense DAL972]
MRQDRFSVTPARPSRLPAAYQRPISIVTRDNVLPIFDTKSMDQAVRQWPMRGRFPQGHGKSFIGCCGACVMEKKKGQLDEIEATTLSLQALRNHSQFVPCLRSSPPTSGDGTAYSVLL